jgi:hypothetical protein
VVRESASLEHTDPFGRPGVSAAIAGTPWLCVAVSGGRGHARELLAVQTDSRLRPRNYEMLALPAHFCIGVNPVREAGWIVVCLGFGVEYGSVPPKPGCAGPVE